jgi:hypothetical protein
MSHSIIDASGEIAVGAIVLLVRPISKQALGLPLPDLPPGRDRLISSGSDCPLPPDIIERELFRH